MAKNPAQELAEIQSEDLLPLYLLHGAESYYPNAIAKKIGEIAIPEHEKGFNEFIFFGKDLTVGDVLNNARRFPMMAERQLVIVKDAEQIQDLNTKDAQNLLSNYAKEPLKSTILVMIFGKSMDERLAYIKAFASNGLVLNAKKLYDNQVPDFIIGICHDKQHKISQKASQLLFEHTGNNLEAIVKEIDKMLINLTEGAEIDDNTIERYVGVSKDYNVFELQKSLIYKDAKKSFQIVHYFAANTKEHPIQPVIMMLFNFFSKVLLVHGSKNVSGVNLATTLKVNPYFVKDYTQAAQNYPIWKLMNIVNALRNADKYSKGVDAGTKSTEDLYKELISEVLN